MAHLLLKDVNKVYPNGFHAVHDFNLEIQDGEFICLVGSSGCGKSTTLRMIAGLEEISSGEFYIDGELANDVSSRDRGIAMVFQSYALYPHLTVAENLAFGLMLEGIDADIIDEKVAATAKILGLTDYLERFPRQLSGGQCQRVAVGRAIIRKVRIFLMDEPLSNLDAKQRVTMRSEIKQIHRGVGATTIYVTHDQTEAMTMSDRIVVMKLGRIQQVGTPFDLYFYPANLFVAGFIGEPPMNFIYGKVEGGKLKLGKLVEKELVLEEDAQELDISPIAKDVDALEGREVVFAFRPEAVSLVKEGEEAPEDGYTFDSTVELTELLGDNTNVYTVTNGVNVILKINPHDTPARDSECVFHVPYKSAYLYDRETELAVETDIVRHKKPEETEEE